ncbi:MAG: methyltransferase domain-containing protein [Elusimicrobia bacterium]|nr:methyltransferase domain-containing protein [Elusimicrobiota bacterium]
MIKRVLKRCLEKAPSGMQGVFYAWQERWYSSICVDRRMVRAIADYFGYTYPQALSLLELGERLNAELWNMLKPGTPKDILKFYAATPFYIFDLGYWHMKRMQKILRRQIVKVSTGTVLDYGGGIGDLTLAFARAGREVVYADMAGRTFDFARWHLRRSGHANISMLDAAEEWDRIWERKYGTIVCVDVIEHVLDPEKVIRKMADSLARDGKLVVTGLDSCGPDEKHPMHLKIGFHPEAVLNSLGFRRSPDWLWLWERPSATSGPGGKQEGKNASPL